MIVFVIASIISHVERFFHRFFRLSLMAAAFSYDQVSWNTFRFHPLTPNVERSVRWEFGDGAFSHEREPEHVFVKHGTYKVTLTSLGEDVSSTATIHIPFFSKENPLVIGLIGSLTVLLVCTVSFAVFLRRLRSSRDRS